MDMHNKVFNESISHLLTCKINKGNSMYALDIFLWGKKWEFELLDLTVSTKLINHKIDIVSVIEPTNFSNQTKNEIHSIIFSNSSIKTLIIQFILSESTIDKFLKCYCTLD